MNKLSVVLIPLFLISGCASIVTTSNDESAIGLRYALPLDRLRVTVVTTKDHADSIKFNPFTTIPVTVLSEYSSVITPSKEELSLYFKKCYRQEPTKITGKISDVTKLQVSDWSGGYSVNVEPQFLIDTDVTINRNNLGYLSSVTVKSEGKADNTLVGAVKLAGTIAGYSLGGPAGGIAVNQFLDFAEQEQKALITLRNKGISFHNRTLKDSIPSHEKSSFRFDLLTTEIIEKSCQQIRTSLIASMGLSDLSKVMEDKVTEVALFLGSIDPNVFKEIKKLKEAISSSEQKLSSISIASANLTSYEEIVANEQLSKAVTRNKKNLEDQAEFYSNKIETAKNSVRKLYNFKDDESKVETIDLDVSALMDPQEPSKVITPNDLPADLLIKNIFDEARIGMTASLVSTFNYEEVSVPKKEDGAKDHDGAFIAYRDPLSVVLTFFKKISKDSGQTEWNPIKQDIHQMITSYSPVGMVPYDASRWSQRDMSLSFTNGFLSSVNYVSGSDAEAISDSLNNAVDGYISNVTSAQKSRLDLQAASRKAAQDELQFRIDTLAKQKSILENKNALDLLSSEESIELSQINQDIQLLEQRKALLEAQTNLTIAENTNQNSIDLGQHQSDLATLQALNALQSEKDGSSNIAAQLLILNSISSLQQQLVDEPDSETLKNDLKKLEIQLKVLLKELEVKGLISEPTQE